MRRLMTLDDLYNYYASQNESMKFHFSKEDEIVVQIPSTLTFEKDSSPTDGLYPVDVRLCFIGDNLNGSRIEKKSMSKALNSAKFRPILGFIHSIDGEDHFYGHNMHMDDDGSVVYDEIPVGVIIEEAKLEYDEEMDKEYAISKGYIYEEYTKAADILRREEKCDTSVELAIRSLSYNSEDKILVLDDFYFSGLTILGYDDDGNKVKPAMQGSNVEISDFSVENNGHCAKFDEDKLIDVLDKFENLLSKFSNINTTGKEDDQMENEVEVIEEVMEEEVTTEETMETPDEVVEEEIETVTEEENEKSVQCSVKFGENVMDFSVSMSDVLYSLSQLVNETYVNDGTYYSVDAYSESKEVIMVDCWTGKAFKQSYKVKKDTYSLIGDRVPVKAIYVTADEEAKLDEMRSNYSVIEEKLGKYEEEPQKMEILMSDEYCKVVDTEEFTELMKKENHFDMSVEEVRQKADEIILSYAKSGKLNFSVQVEEEKNVAKKTLPNFERKTSRYGNLFKK